MDLMQRRRVMLANIVVLVKKVVTSVTGLVSFVTNIVQPVKVTCEFSPVQEGSGDPSPDNVRPISGWTGCIISCSGADTENTQTLPVSWESEAGTVYGGTVTLNEDGSADLVDDRIIVTYDGDEGWNNSGNYYFVKTSNVYKGQQIPVANILLGVSNRPYKNLADLEFAMTRGDMDYVNVRYDAIGSLDAFKELLSNTPLVVAYKRRYPQTYHFDSIGQLKSLLGTNNIWHNLNGSITTEYWEKQ